MFGYAAARKRAHPKEEDFVDDAENKRMRGRGPDAEDAWGCAKCGNWNYGGRTTCNMRSCKAPKPLEAWICPSCGNENRENRPFCNIRSCGLAKPGLRSQDLDAI